MCPSCRFPALYSAFTKLVTEEKVCAPVPPRPALGLAPPRTCLFRRSLCARVRMGVHACACAFLEAATYRLLRA